MYQNKLETHVSVTRFSIFCMVQLCKLVPLSSVNYAWFCEIEFGKHSPAVDVYAWTSLERDCGSLSCQSNQVAGGSV